MHVNNMNPQNNRFHMDLEQNHEAYKFVMIDFALTQSPNSSFNNRVGVARAWEYQTILEDHE